MAKDDKSDEDEIAIDLSGIKKFFNFSKKGKDKARDQTVETEQHSEISSRKKDKKKHAGKPQSEDEDIEINFDFSKLKSIFSKKSEKIQTPGAKPLGESQAGQEDLGISIDFSGIFSFVKKYRTVFLLLIPILLAVFLRAQTFDMPITDDWAIQNIVGNIQSQMKGQIDAKYPNLPEQNKQALINSEFEKFARANKAQLDQEIARSSNFYKSQFKDEEGNTYLSTIDPYYWLRHSQNVIEHGHPGDEIREGKPYDTFMLAPQGRFVPKGMLYAYLTAYLYLAINFITSVPLVKVAFFMPALLAALSVIPAYFIARKFSGEIGGFFAAVMVAIHPAFLSRSLGGISDTDPFNILFPLLVTWMFISALESRNLAKGILFSSLSGIFVGIFSFGWDGWWYIFDFIIGSTMAYFIYYLVINRNELKEQTAEFLKKKQTWSILVLLFVFFTIGSLFTVLFIGLRNYQTFYLGPASFIALKEVGKTTIWPNVFTTVAEQTQSNLRDVISNLGGSLLFFISILGILLTMTMQKEHGIGFDRISAKDIWFYGISGIWILLVMYSLQGKLYLFLAALLLPFIVRISMALKDMEKDIDFSFACLMIFWLAATIFASVKGIRYVLLAVPVFSIGFGIFVGWMYSRFSSWIAVELRTSVKWTKPVIFTLMLLLLIAPLKSAYALSYSRTSDMNDAWFSALTKIDNEASENAIINSWWDFGHWFKYIGNRPVTFDGTSQQTRSVHWIGKALVTDDENLAVDILRMLDCGNEQASSKLQQKLGSELSAVNTIYEILPLGSDAASKSLSLKGIPQNDADEILTLTHCTPPENYFITSEDMVLKAPVWAHFGLWDFRRAQMYNTVFGKPRSEGIKILSEEFGLSPETADLYYYEIQTQKPNDWISPWPGYTRTSVCRIIENSTARCDNNLIVNLTSMQASISAAGANKLISLVYADSEGVHEKIIDGTGTVTAALVPAGKSYESVYMDPKLANSMFTMLFYFKGHGLKHFKLFDSQRSIFGTRIYVWKIDWQGKEKNVIEEFAAQQNKSVS